MYAYWYIKIPRSLSHILRTYTWYVYSIFVGANRSHTFFTAKKFITQLHTPSGKIVKIGTLNSLWNERILTLLTRSTANTAPYFFLKSKKCLSRTRGCILSKEILVKDT